MKGGGIFNYVRYDINWRMYGVFHVNVSVKPMADLRFDLFRMDDGYKK